MGRIGLMEIIILLGVALLLFGGSRIANVGKGLGEGIRNFKKGLKEGDEESPKLTEGDEPGAEKPAARREPAHSEKS